MIEFSELIHALETEIKQCPIYGKNAYLAGAELYDGLILNRVIFYYPSDYRLLIRELRNKSYDLDLVKHAVLSLATTSTIDPSKIKRVFPSRSKVSKEVFDALSDPLEQQEYGNFALEMRDGKTLYFDLNEDAEFYGPPEFLDLPDPYTFDDVIQTLSCTSPLKDSKDEKINYYGLETIFHCCLFDTEDYV